MPSRGWLDGDRGGNKARHSKNLLLQNPFYDRRLPMSLGNHVTLDAGKPVRAQAPAMVPR